MDIDNIIHRADSENSFAKTIIRKYNFEVVFKDYHELSLMFELLHTLNLSLERIIVVNNQFSDLGLTFKHKDNEEKVRRFVEKLMEYKIKIVGGII